MRRRPPINRPMESTFCGGKGTLFGRVILDLCGGTGSWSAPYTKAGYTVILVTLPEYDVRLFPSRPSQKHPRLPWQFDNITKYIGNVHGILAASPCTVFSGSGARWPRTDEEILEGLSMADACLRIIHTINPMWWALENPVGKLRKWIGPPQITFNPCDYGDPYTKRTLLWGNFNPPKKSPVEPTEGSKMRTQYFGHHETEQGLRSITPPGFAKAFFEANP